MKSTDLEYKLSREPIQRLESSEHPASLLKHDHVCEI